MNQNVLFSGCNGAKVKVRKKKVKGKVQTKESRAF
jgi:hypothetical protein